MREYQSLLCSSTGCLYPAQKDVEFNRYNPAESNMRSLKTNQILWNLSKRVLVPNLTNAKAIPINVIQQRLYASKDGDGDKCDPKKWGQKLLPMHVQKLDDVLKQFLRTCEPALTKEEYECTVKMANEFKENEGAELQTILEAVGKKECNWLAPRWLSAAYLTYRDPVTIYSSPGMTFPRQNFENIKAYLDYTAKVIYGIGEFKQIVDEDKIPKVKMGQLELDNSQFGKVLGTCRVPCRFSDHLVYNPCTDYIVVIYMNHFYKLPIYNKDGKLIKSEEIAKQLDLIMKCQSEPGPEYGLLTTDKRDNWAEAYMLAHKIQGFKEAVEIVQDSLFTVSLDKCINFEEDQSDNVLSLQLIHGGGPDQNAANRWMDKTIQLIANPNGHIGFTYEHSPAEGQPIAMMMDYVVKKITQDEEFGSKGECYGELGAEKIFFPPPNTCVETWINEAKRNLSVLVKNLEMQVCRFTSYGKDWIKKKKLGPDSYIQMAIQLAYYRVHKKVGPQYESAHLRIFYGGRTETIRTLSVESKAFVEAMADNTLSKEQKANVLRDAVNGHQAYTKLALQGRGVDRHLLGLKLMAAECGKPVPKFYQSPGFVKSAHFNLSTSQVASVYDAWMCYGPLVSDGYGCCYNPRDCDIIFAVSAWNTDTTTSAIKFCKELNWALLAMYEVLGGTPICKL